MLRYYVLGVELDSKVFEEEILFCLVIKFGCRMFFNGLVLRMVLVNIFEYIFFLVNWE